MNTRTFSFPRDSQRNTKYDKRRMPLRLEVLEDRSLPSTVMNLNDSGFGSLRQAIMDTPSSGTVDFQPGLSGTITLTSDELLIDKDLNIAGPGAGVITVSGDNASRVFELLPPVSAAISGLTIADGSISNISSSQGGGIFNRGRLTITDSVVSGNTTSGTFAQGGGIYNAGTLTITESIISDNSATGTGVNASASGAGITNLSTLTIINSTVRNNRASAGNDARGGGIDSSGTLTISGSTINENEADSSLSFGGGISFDFNLNIIDSTIRGNRATGLQALGGGVSMGFTATVTIVNSTISDNAAVAANFTSAGGGLDLSNNSASTVTIMNSTISGNAATGMGAVRGGGINFGNSPLLTIINSTISGNVADGPDARGGGIFAIATLVLTNSTISRNSATGSGGGVDAFSGTPPVANTILAGNTAPSAPDVSGTLNSQGHNLIGDGTGGSGYDPTDLVGTADFPIDPKLGPLQDNGGPTFTMALLPDSPAIDAGDNAFAPGPFDQRGPGFPRIVNGTIDIGAFEVQAVALTVQCSVTVPVLWPPNHQLVNVGLSVQVSDPNATIQVQVYVNDDALPSDAADLAPGRLRLRSQRQGSGSGRVYLIVVTATDAAGNVAVSECTVVVPHDHSAHSLAAVEQQAADAEAYFQAFHTAPPGYRLLG
jgi:hypothetical protein